MGDPVSYFLFQPVLHDSAMCYLVCGMVHIKEHLLLTGKSNSCSGGSRLFSLAIFSGSILHITIWLTSHNQVLMSHTYRLIIT